MLTINLKERFRNKTFILAMVGTIVLLAQQLGFKDIIPSNYVDIVNSLLTILTMVGIVVDTSTKGISDQVVSTTTVQAVNLAEEVKIESGTTSINNTVTENSQDKSITVTNTGMETTGLVSIKDSSINASVQANYNLNASSKIAVDNPENIQEIGATVNPTSAVAPN